MGQYDYDILILGSGSAAFAAALKARGLGASVAMTERREVGGTCVNRGCVPSKNLIRAAEIFHMAGHHPFSGIKTRQGGVDFASLASKKDDLVKELRQKKYLDLVKNSDGISILKGSSRFRDAHTIEVDGKPVTAEKFLVATGARTFIPPIPGLNSIPFLTSDLLSTEEGFGLRELPQSLIIIGGGVIACELGQMFQRLGSKVTILQRGPRLLTKIDEEIATTLCQILNDEGVESICNVEVQSIEGSPKGVIVTAAVSGKTKIFCASRLLVATGVQPNTEGLGLESVNVSTDPLGFIKTDETMRTTAPNIWSAGDVTGPPFATPIGAREGVIAAENMLDPCCQKRMDYRVIPRTIFTEPEVATVGLTFEEAKKEGFDADVRSLPLTLVPKAACILDTRGVVKMVIEQGTKRILGVHLIAHNGSDIIHEAAVAIRAGWTTDDLIETIHVYPSMAEAIRMVAQTFEKDVSRLSCCAE